MKSKLLECQNRFISFSFSTYSMNKFKYVTWTSVRRKKHRTCVLFCSTFSSMKHVFLYVACACDIDTRSVSVIKHCFKGPLCARGTAEVIWPEYPPRDLAIGLITPIHFLRSWPLRPLFAVSSIPPTDPASLMKGSARLHGGPCKMFMRSAHVTSCMAQLCSSLTVNEKNLTKQQQLDYFLVRFKVLGQYREWGLGDSNVKFFTVSVQKHVLIFPSWYTVVQVQHRIMTRFNNRYRGNEKDEKNCRGYGARTRDLPRGIVRAVSPGHIGVPRSRYTVKALNFEPFFQKGLHLSKHTLQKNEGCERFRKTVDNQTLFCSCFVQNSSKEATDFAQICT
jgi:hypothetical protein